MNLEQYVSDATRTESLIENVTIPDSETFAAALQIFILSGQILDAFKKNVFYGRPVDWAETEIKFEKIEMVSGVGFAGRETDLDVDPRMFHAIIGTATEATELMEALWDDMNGAPLDLVNVLEEFGDINWYEAIASSATGIKLDDVLNANIDKLKKRFPEKFTSDEANNRDLTTERDTLETGLKN